MEEGIDGAWEDEVVGALNNFNVPPGAPVGLAFFCDPPSDLSEPAGRAESVLVKT